jgi:phosphoribosylformylglycinamidine synthase subunit PurL
MGEACKAFNTPVTGGNVSFYNESPDSAVYPTPVIGMVGLIEDISYMRRAYFQDEGDLIYLIGQTKAEIGGSEFIKEYCGLVTGDCPSIDLELERKTQQAVLHAIRRGWVKSAHDLADGGLATALAECCIMNEDKRIGATIQLTQNNQLPEYLLFSESQSRFVLSAAPQFRDQLEKHFRGQSIEVSFLGKTGGNSFKINHWIDLQLETLNRAYYRAIPEAMTL